MRSVFFLVLITIGCVFTKNNIKSLTESLGQEVIEIGVPAKGLPAELEEEPSAELEDEEKITSTTLTAGTKKDTKKPTTIPISESNRRKSKEYNKVEETKTEEEAKIEKELAEIYKDNIDYKADSSEVTKEVTSSNDIEDDKKLGLRSRNYFKFQPDLNDKVEVERFRTSVDEISCDKKVNKLTATQKPLPDSAMTAVTNVMLVSILPTLLYL